MSPELTQRLMRYGVITSLFIAFITLQGVVDLRATHQIVFMLAMISLFSLLLDNVWIMLFLLWTVFLYSFFKFTTGSGYLSNIFFGCVLFFITKQAFKKEHIDLFINGFLWFVFANVVYMSIQLSGMDFIYTNIYMNEWLWQLSVNEVPNGFMGHISIAATLIALAIPVLASRGSKWAWIGATGLFVPLIILKTSLCFLVGAAGFLFILYFKIPRMIWVCTVISLILAGVFYMKNIDALGTERLPMWRNILKDSMIHPVTGWGLDSFANITSYKDFRYSNRVQKFPSREIDGKLYNNITVIDWWGNPHNLYISLFFEWGAIGLLLLSGYIRGLVIRFCHAVKNPNTLGLAGFILVFFGISFGHFPIFLARLAPIIICSFALFEKATE